MGMKSNKLLNFQSKSSKLVVENDLKQEKNATQLAFQHSNLKNKVLGLKGMPSW
jgi:hypothetical protein